MEEGLPRWNFRTQMILSSMYELRIDNIENILIYLLCLLHW